MSKTKQNARLLADAERRLSQTGNDITVVRVEPMGVMWRVHFSESVHLSDFRSKCLFWHVSNRIAPDALDAYLWGLKVIEQHKGRIRNGEV